MLLMMLCCMVWLHGMVVVSKSSLLRNIPSNHSTTQFKSVNCTIHKLVKHCTITHKCVTKKEKEERKVSNINNKLTSAQTSNADKHCRCCEDS